MPPLSPPHFLLAYLLAAPSSIQQTVTQSKRRSRPQKQRQLGKSDRGTTTSDIQSCHEGLLEELL